MEKSESIAKLSQALIKFHKLVQPVVKKNTNPYYKSKYADLGQLIQDCSKLAAECGLVVIQMLDDGKLTTILSHESGEFLKSSTDIACTKQDPQAIGSAITYFRRYAYKAILGIPEVDDDANAASSKSSVEKKIDKKRIDKMLEAFFKVGVTKEQIESKILGSSVYDITEQEFRMLSDEFKRLLSKES